MVPQWLARLYAVGKSHKPVHDRNDLSTTDLPYCQDLQLEVTQTVYTISQMYDSALSNMRLTQGCQHYSFKDRSVILSILLSTAFLKKYGHLLLFTSSSNWSSKFFVIPIQYGASEHHNNKRWANIYVLQVFVHWYAVTLIPGSKRKRNVFQGMPPYPGPVAIYIPNKN